MKASRLIVSFVVSCLVAISGITASPLEPTLDETLSRRVAYLQADSEHFFLSYNQRELLRDLADDPELVAVVPILPHCIQLIDKTDGLLPSEMVNALHRDLLAADPESRVGITLLAHLFNGEAFTVVSRLMNEDEGSYTVWAHESAEEELQRWTRMMSGKLRTLFCNKIDAVSSTTTTTFCSDVCIVSTQTLFVDNIQPKTRRQVPKTLRCQ